MLWFVARYVQDKKKLQYCASDDLNNVGCSKRTSVVYYCSVLLNNTI